MVPHRNELERRHISGTARFLTWSCYHRLRFFDNDKIKDAFVTALVDTARTHHADVIAWVVMPEHVHLIVYFEESSESHEQGQAYLALAPDPVPPFLKSLKQPFARTVLNRWRKLDAPILNSIEDPAGVSRFWQPGGGYDRNVIGDELLEKIRYIHNNPVRRDLCPDSVSWKWSSARAYRALPAALGPPVPHHLIPKHSSPLI